MVAGNTKALGVLLQSLKEQLDTDTWIVGSSISILLIAGCLLGKRSCMHSVSQSFARLFLCSIILSFVHLFIRGFFVR